MSVYSKLITACTVVVGAMAAGNKVGDDGNTARLLNQEIKYTKCKRVMRNGLSCVSCKGLYHFGTCSGVKKEQLHVNWMCSKCVAVKETKEDQNTSVLAILTNEITKLNEEVNSLHTIVKCLSEDVQSVLQNQNSEKMKKLENRGDNQVRMWSDVVQSCELTDKLPVSHNPIKNVPIQRNPDYHTVNSNNEEVEKEIKAIHNKNTSTNIQNCSIPKSVQGNIINDEHNDTTLQQIVQKKPVIFDKTCNGILNRENVSLQGKQKVYNVQSNKWSQVTRKTKVHNNYHNTPGKIRTEIPLQNRFQVLSESSYCNKGNLETTKLDHHNIQIRESKDIKQPHSKNKVTSKIRIYADSQGRNVASYMMNNRNSQVISTVKPGAIFDKVSQEAICESVELCNKDLVVFLSGTNDIAQNEGDTLLRCLRNRLQNLRHTNVLVFTVPHRYDLPEWSCVNMEVERVNKEIHKLSRHFKNVRVVDISKLNRQYHTVHGLHLNTMGKKHIGVKITNVLQELMLDANNTVIPLQWDVNRKRNEPTVENVDFLTSRTGINMVT